MSSKEYFKQYYLKNKEKLGRKNKLWRKNNPEMVKEARHKWKQQNKDKVKVINRRYYLKTRIPVTKQICPYCGKELYNEDYKEVK